MRISIQQKLLGQLLLLNASTSHAVPQVYTNQAEYLADLAALIDNGTLPADTQHAVRVSKAVDGTTPVVLPARVFRW